MTPETVQSIKYLQADAHLPQTGVMNAATRAAMQYMLARLPPWLPGRQGRRQELLLGAGELLPSGAAAPQWRRIA